MTLTNPKPLGWAFGEILTSTQMNSFGTQLPLAVDGSGGGTYSPSAKIALASKGLQVTGIFDAPGLGWYNVDRYDATGDGVADDTAELQAAEDAVSAAGGGVLFFPPGTYRITADIVKKHKVHWWGIPGTVTITIDHATDNTLTFTGSAWTQETVIHGINFEAAQSNSGIFCNEVGTLYLLRFRHCKLNKSAALLTGRLFSTVSNSELVLEDCDFRAVKISDNHFALSRLELIRGKLTMAPGATAELILVSGEVVCDSTEFVQVSITGNVAFLDCAAGGFTKVENARFDIDDSGAGAASYAFRVNGGEMHTENNEFFNDAKPYEFAVTAAAGSKLQLLAAVRVTGSGDLTVPNGYASVLLESAKATAPAITMPAFLFLGQPLDMALKNTNAGTWAAAPGFSSSLFEETGMDGLLTLDTITTRFVAMDVDGGADLWVQVGAHVKIV